MFYNARAHEVANLKLCADIHGSTSGLEFVFLIHSHTAESWDLEQVTLGKQDLVIFQREMRISLQTRVSFHRSRS